MNYFVLVIKLFEPALASEEPSGGHGHHELEVVDDDLLHVVDVDGTIHQLKHLIIRHPWVTIHIQ